MFRWIISGLFVAILAFGGLIGAPSAQAQVPPRPPLNGNENPQCQQSAVSLTDRACGDDVPCKFGSQIGGINNVDTCASSCANLAASCMTACLLVVDRILLCHYPTIGGTVSGLGAGNSVVLRNNGGDALTVSANGAFTFPMWVRVNDTYAVTASHPAGQTCGVANGSGTATAAAVIPTPYGVTNVAVTCVTHVPTMSEWGMVVLIGMLALGGLLLLSPMVVRTPSPEA